MNRLITITICSVVLFSVSSAFAPPHSGTTNTQEAEVNAYQMMLSAPWFQANPNYYSDYSPLAPPAYTGFPNLLHVGPYERGIVLWNGYDLDEMYLDGTYTKEMLEYTLKRAGNPPFDIELLRVVDFKQWFTECGRGFEKVISADAKYAPEPKIDLRTQVHMIDQTRIIREYERLAIVNVGGNDHKTFFLTLMYALNQGRKIGGQIALPAGGMNNILFSNTVGLGFGVHNTSGHNSISGTVGFSTGETGTKGRAAVQLVILRKREVPLGPTEKTELEKWYEKYAPPKPKQIPAPITQEQLQHLREDIEKLKELLEKVRPSSAEKAVELKEKAGVLNN